MDEQSTKKKSAHLKELEETFERHTRRFSPFAVLGLTQTDEDRDEPSDDPEPTSSSPSPFPGSVRPTEGLPTPAPGSKTPEPEGGLQLPPSSGTDGPTHGMGLIDPPFPGLSRPAPLDESHINEDISVDNMRVRPWSGSIRPTPDTGLTHSVVVDKKTTTVEASPTPGPGPEGPPMDGSQRPPAGYVRPTTGSQDRRGSLAIGPTVRPERADDQDASAAQTANAFGLAEVVAAVQLGHELGKKARRVLAYLSAMRASEHEAYTVPVGYGQISAAVGVDADYLRRKVLPKLARLGLIAKARKSLEGTVYHLPHPANYVTVVAEGVSGRESSANRRESPSDTRRQDAPSRLPEWIDRETWGWLSAEQVRRLVEKSGSEARARETLDIIRYNETHGPPERRVRNRQSVLMHYLTSAEAEIWPNDGGFETLDMRRAIVEKEQALREKALAEEALQARQEAERLRFLASLSEAQLRWLRAEAKRRADAQPGAQLLNSRYPLYKAEEEQLVQEWLDRAAYGEKMPAAEE